MLRATIRRVALELGVRDVRDPKQWLKRLFVLEAGTTRTWPVWLEPVVHHLPTAGRSLRSSIFSLVLRVLTAPLWVATHWGNALRKRVDTQRLEAQMNVSVRRLTQLPPALQYTAVAVAGLCFWLAISTPLGWTQQILLFALLWMAAMAIRRLPGNLPTLLLIGFSLVASGRYIWWRFTETLSFNGVTEHVLGYGLVLAEAYTWLIMLLGYVQNAFPLGRKPAPLPIDRSTWPTVDVLIPTYNEPLSVVKPGVYAALGLDWPREKLRVHLLDDGRRPEFRAFAEAAGAHYLVRPNNHHAKAGNLNHALQKTHGEFVAIFDCDHVPVRSFLTTTLGWFQRDPKCAMVQTPHHFFSPDPFERNLDTFRRMPNEGSLFYGLVQDGNDLWNATFFCGSCAVLRRTHLEDVGGIAAETVTEDAHTALKLHRRGYNTAYLSQAQAAGLSTESLSGHIGQRIRWARGMAQIFRIDNPLFGPGLSLFQRLCYSNAMLHFFNGLPRLVFLTSPLAYLYFELHVIQAAAIGIAAYAIPHLVLSQVSNSRMQGRFRHSFWAEVYESVLAWYIALPTTLALINPRMGAFNVTTKGGLIERSYFDARIARPYLILIALNLIGVILGVLRLLFWNVDETSTVVMNLCWALYNLAMLGTAVGVSIEARQVRRTHRIPLQVPVRLRAANGRVVDCQTTDYSSGGVGVAWPHPTAMTRGESLELELSDNGTIHRFPCRVALQTDSRLGLRFEAMTLQQEMRWIQATFGRPDAWLHWKDVSERDRPLSSFGEVLRFGARGYRDLMREWMPSWFKRPRPGLRRALGS